MHRRQRILRIPLREEDSVAGAAASSAVGQRLPAEVSGKDNSSAEADEATKLQANMTFVIQIFRMQSVE